MSTRTATLDLLRESPFFEGVEQEHLEYFARHACGKTFESGDHVIKQRESATAFYVLARGKIELSFTKAGSDVVEPNEEAGSEMEGQTLPHVVGHCGYPVGFAPQIPAQAIMPSRCAQSNLTAAAAVAVEDSYRKLAATVRA